MKTERCYIIAEIGVNHGGDIELAKQMIDTCVEVGADAVKFQTFTAASLVGKNVPKVSYQQTTTDARESHYDMIKRLELSEDAHCELFDYCLTKKIDFISTPYDVLSAKFLVALGVRILKTASADIVDFDLHEYIASQNVTALVSTGMATLGEIEPITNLYRSRKKAKLILLHCVSNYPCKMSSLNLRVIQSLGAAFNTPVGYSDHSEGNLASVVAVSLGSKIIEKHFTLDKKLDGPDHKASSTPEEFRSLVRDIRNAEIALGSPIKTMQQEEAEMAKVSRKSLTLARHLNKGDIITRDALVFKRPGTGLLGDMLSMVVEQRASRKLTEGDLLKLSDIIFE